MSQIRKARMVARNTHGGRDIFLIKQQQRAGSGMIDPLPASGEPPLKCNTVFANIMIKSAETAVFFSAERAAKPCA